MTENKVIELLKNNYPKTCKVVGGRLKGGFDDHECDVGIAIDLAINALEEVQQYRAIGTLKECRAAAVKQTAKKPIFNNNLSDTLSVFHCECGNTIKVSHDIGIMNNNNAPNYCSKCGCKFDWSDEE